MIAPGRRRAIVALAAVLGLSGASASAEEPVTIFAAASTANAIQAVAAAYAASGAGQLRPVFAASSTLAEQIARGAPADLFLSANERWMDHLAARGGIEPDSRIDLLGNRLVLIAPVASPLVLRIEPGMALAAALGERRLAIGDPGHVPAGIYAKAALERLGVWPELADKVALAADVRGAVALVDRGEAAAGVVYATDAALSDRVRVVATFPEDLAGRIAYPLAVVAGRRTPAVEAVYRFLRGPAARAIFDRHGFTRPSGEG